MKWAIWRGEFLNTILVTVGENGSINTLIYIQHKS